MTFNEAEALFKTARNKAKGKPLGNNVRLFQYGAGYAVQYHQTIILVIKEDGSYQYNNGGWFTVSTKKNLNKFGPLYIFQRNHAWYYNSLVTNVVIPYVNGMWV